MGLLRTWVAVVATTAVGAGSAAAQATPFLFTEMPRGGATTAAHYVYYELGYGERTFEPVAGERVEQALGFRAALGSRFTVLARTGIATGGPDTRFSPRGEVLYNRALTGTLRLAAGVGYAREYTRTDVALARVGLGRETERSMLHGNLLFEKPFSGDRDALDLITTIGAGRRVGSALTMSVEAVAQDLEGFWDPTEKDGGARLMAGPSLTIAPPTARWQLTVGGGPILRATRSAFASGADRPLPTRNGYVLRTAFGLDW